MPARYSRLDDDEYRNHIPLTPLPPQQESRAETHSEPLLSDSSDPINQLPQHTHPTARTHAHAHAHAHTTTTRTRLTRTLNAVRHCLPTRIRLSRLVLVLGFLSLPLLLVAIGLLAYIKPAAVGLGGIANGSKGFCIPFNLHRISSSAHYRYSCYSNSTLTSHSDTSSATSAMSDASSATHGETPAVTAGTDKTGTYPSLGRLAGFLQAQKDAFIGDIRGGNGKGWVVVMGNDAGDLDSIASSIAYAHLSSTLFAERMVPLILTPSSMMTVRPENLLALKNASIPLSVLLHPESLPVPTTSLASLGVRFALVDHNKLLPQFGPIIPGVVQGIIDHHDDDGEHKDADIRFIQVPTGSCSSLVTTHFMPTWQAALSSPSGEAGSPIPNELATLLLSAGLIDTHGLKANGKAVEADYTAGAFLYPLSPWFTASASSQAVSSSFIPAALHDQGKELNEIKHNVTFLSTPDLLIRDYKPYVFATSSTVYPTLKVGLSTVPLGLKAWLEKEGGEGWSMYLKAIDKFMLDNQLDIEGVLTTFKNKRGKKKREILLIVRVGGALDVAAAKNALDYISQGLEKDVVLSLVAWEKRGWKRFLNRKKRAGLDGKNRFGRVWEQSNAEATRKVVAPLVRDLVAQLK